MPLSSTISVLLLSSVFYTSLQLFFLDTEFHFRLRAVLNKITVCSKDVHLDVNAEVEVGGGFVSALGASEQESDVKSLNYLSN